MEFRHLKFALDAEAKLAGSVGILTISRPEALNALNQEVIEDLEQFVRGLNDQPNLRVVILTGSGEKAFVAGADIKQMKDMTVPQAKAMAVRGQKLFQDLESSRVVSLAAVNGFALGGGLELAMSCDIMMASSKARFGLPEVSLGLIPGYGGTQRLPRFIGKSLARMVTLTGDIFSADQGYAWGLFAQVVAPEELMNASLKVARTIASRSPAAVALAKRSISEGFDRNQEAGMGLEADFFAKTFSTEDHNEGIAAFIGKRQPEFKGK